MNDARPSWLTEDCPSWCVAEHAEQDHLDDRVHQGVIATVPVVLREQTLEDGRVVGIDHAAEFDVVRFRPVGAMEWLFIGDGEYRLLLSVESAARLRAALGSVCTCPGTTSM